MQTTQPSGLSLDVGDSVTLDPLADANRGLKYMQGEIGAVVAVELNHNASYFVQFPKALLRVDRDALLLYKKKPTETKPPSEKRYTIKVDEDGYLELVRHLLRNPGTSLLLRHAVASAQASD